MTAAPDQPRYSRRSTQPSGGAPEPCPKRILLIACGALAREIIDLKSQAAAAGGWDHLELICLPADLHNTPDRIPDAVRSAVMARRGAYDEIKLLYADCGTGGRLQALCADLGIEMLAGPHCYAVFDGVTRFAERGEMRSFFLTDFLVRQFDAFVWRPLGLDRHPQLRDMYFGHYTTLVHLAQTEDSELAAEAERHAERLGLGFERRLTGYGDLAAELHRWAGTRG